MKNRVVTLLLIATLVLLAFALVACNDGSLVCVDHEWTDYEVVDGYARTQICSLCGVTRRMCDPISHNFKEHTDNGDGTHTSICGSCGGVYENLPHNFDGVVTIPAGCETPGVMTYTCICGASYEDDIPATGHAYLDVYTYNGNGQHFRICTNNCGVSEIIDCYGGSATCTVPGNCEVCGGEYLNPTGHTEVIDPAIPATCTENGLTEGKSCSVCNAIIVAQEVVPAGHTIVDDPAISATCTEDGLTAGKHCSVCNTVIVAQEVIPAGHTEVVDLGTPATCTEDGLTDGKHCSVCNTVTIPQEVIPASGHTMSEKKENVVASTCTENGGYDKVTYCTICKEVLAREHIPVSALGHSYENDCDSKCDVCGFIRIPEDHIYDDETCDLDCNVCGANRNVPHVDLEPADNICDCCGRNIVPPCEEHTYTDNCDDVCDICYFVRDDMPHSYSSDCDTTCECGETREALDKHMITNWVMNGSRHERHCENCDSANEDAPHSFQFEYVDGTTVLVCSDCGFKLVGDDGFDDVVIENVSGLVSHQYEVIVVEPTCTTSGSVEYICSICGESGESSEIEALRHSFGDVWSYNNDGTHSRVCLNGCGELDTERQHCTGGNATCTEAGVCEVCGGEYLPATDEHVYAEEVTTPAGCETVGEMTYTCQCGDSYTEEIPATGHAYGEWAYNNDGTHSRVCENDANHEETNNCSGGVATCENAGKCTVCDGAYIPALEHKYPENWTNNEVNHIKVCENNCGTNLVRDHQYYVDESGDYICLDCGHIHQDEFSQPEEDSDHVHQYVSVVVAPTCTSRGSIAYKCKGCDHTVTNFIEPLEHTAGESVVENLLNSTCYSKGSYDTVVYCTVCSTELNRETAELEMLPHNIKYVSNNTEDDFLNHTGTHKKYCENEGCDLEEIENCELTANTCEELPYCVHCADVFDGLFGHEFCGEVLEVVDPTCKEDGYKLVQCMNAGCSATQKQYISGTKLPHTEEDIPGKDATCDEDGLTDGKYCSVCGTTIVEQEVIPAGHVWREWISADISHHVKVCERDHNHELYEYHNFVTGEPVAPTCEEKGYTPHNCSICGESYSDSYVPALGHTEVVDEAVAPTCTEKGYTEGSHCSTCGEILIERVEIPANEHNYESIVTDPTCTEAGYTTYTCTACGDSYTDGNVPATGHAYLFDVTVPTCTEKGYTTYTCSACDHSYIGNEVETTGHDYDLTWINCGDGLHHKQVCKNGCGVDIIRDHHYAAYGSGYKCVECEYVYGAEITEPSQGEGHTHEYINAVSKPDCLNPGYIISKCRICDHTVVCLIDANPHIEPDNWIDNGVNHVKYCTNDCGTIVVEEAHKYKAEHTTEGTINYVCEVCGNVYSDTIIESDEPSGCKHQYEPVLIEPTCEDPGTISYKCSICGSVKENSYGEIPALGHRYSDDDWTSCDVNNHERYCLNGCGTRETEAHDFDESATITPNNNGTHNLTCTKCGTVIEECSVNVGDSTPSVVTCDKCQGLATRLATSPLQVGDKIVIAVNDGSDTTYMGEEFTAVGAEQATVYFIVEESEVEGEFYLSAVINGEKVYLTRDGDDLLYLTEPNEFSSWNITIDEDGNAQLQCGDTNRDFVGVDNGGGICQFAVNVPDNDIEISIYHVNASGSHVHVDDVADCVCDICGNTHHTFSIDDIVITDPTCTEKGFTTHICACGDLSYIDSYVDAIGHSVPEAWTPYSATEHAKVCANGCNEILETEAHDIQRYWLNPEDGLVYEREICLICGYMGELGSEIERPYSYAAGSEYELKILVENGYFASLDNDITITSPVLVASKEIVEIELNGFDLIANNPDENGKTVVFDVDGGTLGIYGEGNVIAEGNSDDTCIAVVSSGKFFTTEEANNLSSTGNYVVIIEGDTGDAECIIGSAIVKATGDNPEYIKVEESEHATSAIVSSGKFYNWNPSEYTLNDIGNHVHMTESVVGDDTIYQVETCSRREGEKVDPTCTEQGYSVKICNDPNCNDVLKYDFVDALGHAENNHDAKAPTCTEIGWDAYVTCSRCDYSTYNEIPAKGHTEGVVVVENKTDATCTTDGSYDNVVYCTVCEIELSRETQTVDALGHDEIEHIAKAPTCTEVGWDAYVTCSRCEYSTYNEIPAKGHTEGAVVVENKADATCTTDGSYDNVVYCTVCEAELSRETQKIDALGHIASYTNITETNHTFVCTRENCGHTAVEEHTFLDTGACSACKYQEYVLETNKDGTLSVVGAGKDFKAGAVTFPETFNGKSVTGITGNNAFIFNDKITSITIPDSYTFISNQAFDNCSNLTSVQFGTNSQLKMIDYYAFNNCESLSSIKIPAFVNTIGSAAFANCPNLTTVEFETGTNLKVISQDIFADCTGLQSIVIPSGIEKIDISAFNGCSGLERIYIPTSLTTIEQNAFYGCAKLSDVCYAGSADEWANGVVVKVPGENLGNNNILNARIHMNSTAIHEYQKVEDAAVAPTCTATGLTAGEHCEYCKTVFVAQEVVDALGHTHTELGNWTNNTPVGGNYSEEKFTCSDICTVCGETIATEAHNIAEINNGSDSRYGCTRCDYTVYNFTLNADGNSYTLSAFGEDFRNYAMKNDGNIVLPSTFNGLSVTEVGASDATAALTTTSQLKTLTIPASVKSIGSHAFPGCSGLTDIYFEENSQLETIGECAFANCIALTSVEIPKSVITLGKQAFSMPSEGNGSLAEVIFEDGSQLKTIGDYAFSSCKQLTTIEIPANVTKITYGAFKNCTSLDTVTFAGNKVTYFGSAIFYGCTSLKNIDVPSTLTTLGKQAFRDCTSLESIVIPAGIVSPVQGIDDVTFAGCTSLKQVVILCKLQTIKLCEENGVVLDAFDGCIALEDIFYAYSEEDFRSINNIDQIEAIKNARIHYNSTSAHEYETIVDEAVEPTCTKKGLTEGSHCSVCESVFVAQKEISANGHNYESVVTAPTCTEDGYTTHTCTVCEDNYVDTPVNAIGHNWGAWTNNGNAEEHVRTCVNDASHTEAQDHTFVSDGSCSVCGYQAYKFATNGTGVTFVGLGDDFTGSNVVIPSTIGGKTVNQIAYTSKSTGEEAGVFGDKALQITSVEIPNTVQSVGRYAFNDCSNLNTVTFEENSTLTRIYPCAFQDCTSLTAVDIPDSVTKIEWYAFHGCTSLKDVTIGESVESIGSGCFYNSAIETITIPKSVKTLDHGAFESSTKLREVTFEAGVGITAIDDRTFYQCSALESITIPAGVTSIGNEAFETCYALVTVNFESSDTLKSIGAQAFKNCNALTRIDIPASVTDVRGSVPVKDSYKENGVIKYQDVYGETFESCDNLQYVTFGGADSHLTKIEDRTFNACINLVSIEIPATVQSIGSEAFYQCHALSTVAFLGDATTSQLKTIGDRAFYDCDKLVSIEIPASVTAIGEKAFQSCSYLQTVTFGKTGETSMLTTIDDYAFNSCVKLTTIVLPDSVNYIGNNAFNDCHKLTCINIPEGVTTIYAGTFEECGNLTTVYIPLSLTTIEEYAFTHTSSIANVYYGGCCDTQWNAISIGTQTNSSFLTATRHYAEHVLNGAPTCTEGVNCEKCGCQHVAPLGHEWGNWTNNGDDTHSRYCVNDASHIETETHSYSEEGVCSVCKAELFNFTYVAESDSYAIDGPTASFSGGDVILPSTYAGRPVTSISASAFDPLASQNEEVADACRSITSVTIPDSVVAVHNDAFCHCINLAEINIGENSQLETIGEYAFGGKEEDGTAVTSIFIPSTVISFDYTSCANTPLTDIYYAGCEHQWRAIPKTGDSSIIAGVTIHVGIHEEIVISADEPTCTTSGLTEGTCCSICGEVLVAQQVVPALGHTEVIDVAKAPTCTETGLTEGKHCSVCSTVLVAQEVAPALGHTEVIDVAVEATCTETGLTEGKHCSVCNEVLVAQEEISNKGHNYVSVVTVPTCIEDGYTTYTCANDGCDSTYTEAGETARGYHIYGDNGACVDCGWQELVFELQSDGTLMLSKVGKDFENGIDFKSGETVTIPETLNGKTVAKLGKSAFHDTKANAVKTLIMPATITSVGSGASRGLINLEKVYYAGTLADWCAVDFDVAQTNGNISQTNPLYYADELYVNGQLVSGHVVIPEEIAVVGKGAFSAYSGITSLELQNGVDSVGNCAFVRCENLASVYISKSVSVIGNSAFYDCDSLETVTFAPNSNLTAIDTDTFSLCSALESIVIPANVVTIDEDSFMGCSNLSTVTFEEGSKLKTLGRGALYATAIKELKLPEGTETIGEYAFYNSKLSTLYVPLSMKSIGKYAFWYSNIRTYKYAGCSPEQWSKINIVVDSYSNRGTVEYSAHTEVTDEAVAPTCTTSGLTEGTCCSICGEVLVAQQVVPALGHTEVIDEAVEATCTEKGLTQGKHCSVCNEVLVAQEVAPALGHTEVIDEAVEATCTETGLTEGKHCSVCSTVLVAQEVVPALGHSASKWTKNDLTHEGTCSTCKLSVKEFHADGDDEDELCDVCGYSLASECIFDVDPYQMDFYYYDGGLVEMADAELNANDIITMCSEYEPNTTVNGLQCYSSSMMPTNFLYMVEEGEVDGTYYLRHQNDYARYLTFDQSAYEEKGQAVFSVKSEAGLWTIDEVDGEIRIRSYVNPDVYILGETNEYYNGDVSIFVNVGTSGSPATIFKSLKKYSGHTQTYKYYHYSSYSDTHCHRLYCVTCDKDGKYLTPCVFEEVVTPATCMANGYTTYTCVLCGFSYTGNETPAIAHTGKSCSTCGLDFALGSDNASLEIHGTNSNFKGGDVILPATAIVPGLTNGEAMPIKTVGAGDFGDTNDWIGVTTLVIPEGVEYIGGAFYNYGDPNKTLTSVVIPDTVKSIGSDAFYGCINLKTVEIGVNSELEYVGEYAFFATGIESIFIPKTVTFIDFDAFDYSCLTDIYYAGTEEEFAAIVSVDTMLLDLPDNATIHYNYVAEE